MTGAKYPGMNVWAVWLITSIKGLAKKKSDRIIWWEARGVGCPGTAAAECVMKPKAASLPKIRVNTGAAKLRKVLLETLALVVGGFFHSPKD